MKSKPFGQSTQAGAVPISAYAPTLPRPPPVGLGEDLCSFTADFLASERTRAKSPAARQLIPPALAQTLSLALVFQAVSPPLVLTRLQSPP